MSLESIIIVNVIFSLGLSIVYFQLYRQYRETYMSIWSLGWLFFSIRIGFDFLRFLGYETTLLLLINQLTTIMSIVLLLWGMYNFSGKSLPKSWLYGAVCCSLLTNAGILAEVPIVLAALPTSTYFAIADMWTGIMFLRLWGVSGFGKYTTGYALIMIGVLNLFYPLIEIGNESLNKTIFFSIAFFLWIVIVTGILLVYFDKVRNDLKISESRFRLLAENARDIVFKYNIRPYKHFEYLSPSLFAITGYYPEELYHSPELLNKILDKNFHPDTIEGGLEALDFNQVSVFLIHSKQGIPIWVEQHLVPGFDQENNLISIEGIVRDISERIKTQNEMARLDQMRILGQTAAGLAHEIRNPMTTVKGFLQLMQSKDDLQPYAEYLSLMIDELDRANDIISEFLSLSKEKRTVLKRKDLNEIIISLQPIIENSALLDSKNVRVNLAEIPHINMDETEIRQLILNLVQNGFEAMEPGGILYIRTVLEDKRVVLAVQDQGKGIEKNVLDKIGEPFITTKEKGTGLGLAVCCSIIHRHGAQISVDTGPGGTTFYISFHSV